MSRNSSTKCFFLTGKNPAKVASAFAPKGTELSFELIPKLEGVNQLPFELELVKLTTGRKGLIESNDLSGIDPLWLDYQPNSLAWPLFSDKLKSLIESYQQEGDRINWISAIINGNAESRTYYIPRFGKKLDVLNKKLTLFSDNKDVIIPCFSSEKVKLYSLFHTPVKYDFWKITGDIHVHESLKKEIQLLKLTGISFEQVMVR